tara:strand:- start:7515 stop:7835 length:321 start_codon:yes stop_codon:yes gene_type:complete
MRCPRCNVMEVEASRLCISCQIAVKVLHKSDKASDKEILKTSALLKMLEGCRECDYKDFGYSAGTLVEGELKWYILQVECGNCNAEYDEVLEVRVINESTKSQPNS